MTVPLDRFQRSFEQAQDANIQAAQMAGAMVEMGRYAQEFTVFGSTFWREGERFYLVSSEADKIVEARLREDMGSLATPINGWTISLLVPSGCAEEVGRTVRQMAAKRMAENYPPAYFKLAAQLAETVPNALAEPLLAQWQEELEGLFAKEQLALFAGALELAWQRGNVTAVGRQKFDQWLKRQRQDMVEDAGRMDRFGQIFYGGAYQKDDGQWAYFANAVKNAAYRQLERCREQGHLTSTLLDYCCWYNYDYPLRQARADFLAHLQRVMDETYQARLMALTKLAPPRSPAAFAQALAEAAHKLPQPSLRALRRLGRQWGVY